MKNSTVALTLSLFPGLGFIYSGKVVRGLFYLFATTIPVIISFLLTITSQQDVFLVISAIGVFFYITSFIDMVIQNSKQKVIFVENENVERPQETERFYTILLSFIPGLGHFQLGMMNRGLTLLASFLGLGIMIMFVTFLTGREEFLIFLAAIPVIWVYGFFDAVQQLNKKLRGETLVDRTIFEDFETRREDGKKSKSIATFLSIFPGAGHLYLGLQRRGVQLMAAFLFSIYILDILRLGIFLFFIPIIWFYSFFDGLQKASRYGKEDLEDTPVISYFINHQKWVGIGLLLLGLYYLVGNIFIPALSPILMDMINIDLYYWFTRYFQTAIVCVLLIGGGIKLLMGSKK
jgi:TM2 domain-containing membrane protein YozV